MSRFTEPPFRNVEAMTSRATGAIGRARYLPCLSSRTAVKDPRQSGWETSKRSAAIIRFARPVLPWIRMTGSGAGTLKCPGKDHSRWIPEIAQRRGLGGDRGLIMLNAETGHGGDQCASVADHQRRSIPDIS
jgi:hypothetical protein